MAKKVKTKQGGGSLFKASSNLLALQKELKGQLFTNVGSDDFLKKIYSTRSTGFVELDMELKTGGWLDNKVNEIFGPPHMGKTFLCMMSCIWENTFNNGLCLWGDIEDEAFDAKWYKKLGGKLNLLHLFRPDVSEKSGEESMESFLALLGTGEYKIAVVDSLQGQLFLPQRILDKKIYDTSQPAVRATVNNEFVEKAAVICSKTKTTLLITNHVSTKIGVTFGNPETRPGGKALKYLADCALRIGTPDHTTGGITGTIVKQKRANVEGNRFKLSTSFDNGVNNHEVLVTSCIKHDVIETVKGRLVYYDKDTEEEISFKTKKAFAEELLRDKQLFLNLKKSLIQYYTPEEGEDTNSPEEEDYEEDDLEEL